MQRTKGHLMPHTISLTPHAAISASRGKDIV